MLGTKLGDADVAGDDDDVVVDGAVHDDGADGAAAVAVVDDGVVAAVAGAGATRACMSVWHMFVPVAPVSVVLSIEARPTSVAIKALDLWHTVTSMWGMWRIGGHAKV